MNSSMIFFNLWHLIDKLIRIVSSEFRSFSVPSNNLDISYALCTILDPCQEKNVLTEDTKLSYFYSIVLFYSNSPLSSEIN